MRLLKLNEKEMCIRDRINCHGGVFVVKRILELLIRSGARPAEPGEFTKKAFLNGRLDLSQAEAVGDLIASQNEYALQSSVNQLKGNIRDKISDLRNKIIYHTAFIESALDLSLIHILHFLQCTSVHLSVYCIFPADPVRSFSEGSPYGSHNLVQRYLQSVPTQTGYGALPPESRYPLAAYHWK